MSNIYKNVPKFESEKFLLRFVDKDDVEDLFAVYSEKIHCHFLIVIIAMGIIFTIQQKIRWNRLLIFG